jgi:hypothetical protein
MQMTAAASTATRLNAPAPVLSMALVQRAALWLMIASGFVVSIEPAPYEMLFVLTLVVFFAGGMRVSMVFAPLIVFLSVYNIGGFLSVMPIIYDTSRGCSSSFPFTWPLPPFSLPWRVARSDANSRRHA